MTELDQAARPAADPLVEPVAPGARKRILFAVPVPGYLRFFEEVIGQLQRQGHDVRIALDRDGKDPSVLARAMALAPVVRMPAMPDLWTPLLQELGTLTDYVRFLSPEFADKGYLRTRMDKYLPPRFARLRRVSSLPAGVVRTVYWAARLLERSIPSNEDARAFLTRMAPDALVISPVVLRGTGSVRQTQLLKAARRLGIPVALAVGSWDHLSSKGLLRVQPDRVFVWNEVQRREAIRYHRVAPAQVAVTGAYLWDLWFRTRPSLSREAFLRMVGLPADRPYVVYTGSSRGIAPPETELTFVRNWLTAIRGAGDAALRDAGVLIRPHPANREHWTPRALDGCGTVAVWPPAAPAVPMTAEEHATYFDTLYYSQAIVGINTSAMIEASIVGRPVLTVRGAAAAQDGSVHFDYLTSAHGGAVQVAATLPEHLMQLSAAVHRPEALRPAIDAFVRTFVRPRGIEQAASRWFLDAVAELCALPRRREPESRPWLVPLTAMSRLMTARVARSRPSSAGAGRSR